MNEQQTCQWCRRPKGEHYLSQHLGGSADWCPSIHRIAYGHGGEWGSTRFKAEVPKHPFKVGDLVRMIDRDDDGRTFLHAQVGSYYHIRDTKFGYNERPCVKLEGVSSTYAADRFVKVCKDCRNRITGEGDSCCYSPAEWKSHLMIGGRYAGKGITMHDIIMIQSGGAALRHMANINKKDTMSNVKIEYKRDERPISKVTAASAIDCGSIAAEVGETSGMINVTTHGRHTAVTSFLAKRDAIEFFEAALKMAKQL